jgi:hypothetical protein
LVRWSRAYEKPVGTHRLATSGAGGLRHLERGRAAFGRLAWHDAFPGLTAAGETVELEAEDLERLGEAAWWVADGPAALRARERACSASRRLHGGCPMEPRAYARGNGVVGCDTGVSPKKSEAVNCLQHFFSISSLR